MLLLLTLIACGPTLDLLNSGESALKLPGASRSTSADGVAAGPDGSVWAVSFHSAAVVKLGERNATLQVPIASPDAPIVLESGSIVVQADDTVTQLGPSGEEQWRAAAPGAILTHLAQRSDGSLVAAGIVTENGANYGYTLFALDATGQEVGRVQLHEQPRRSIAVGPDDQLYMSAGEFVAFSPALEKVWSTNLPASVDAIAVDQMRVYAHTISNHLAALDPTTGSVLWTASGVGSHPVLTSDERLFVTNATESNGGVWVIDARDGDVLSYSHHACLSGTVGADDHLYAACRFPELYPDDAFPDGAPFLPTRISPAGIVEVPRSSVDSPGPSFGKKPARESVVLLDGEAWFVGGTEVLHYRTTTRPAQTAWSSARAGSSRLGRAQ